MSYLNEKPAKTRVARVFIVCPHCNSPNDYRGDPKLGWDANDYEMHFARDKDDMPMCSICGGFYTEPETNPFTGRRASHA